ncbi:oligosaccharide flippase family protein [Clostridium perfringens]|uniref:oligosaccharide flippase family protein n=1 Tax=Clostridium perfringens TaxID=1502 RepID=UPI0039ECFB09
MSVKKNFLYNVLYQILIIIIPLITTPYIARVIGPKGVGIQSYTFSVASYFVLFAMLGLNNYGSRTIAAVRDDKTELSKNFLSIYTLQLIMSILVIVAYTIYLKFFVTKYKIFFLIQLIYIVAAIFDINWFFFGIEKFKLTVTRNSIIKIITVISIFIFVRDSGDLYIYSIILALSTLISQLILWNFVNKYINFEKISVKEVVVHFKPNLVLFIPVIAISMYRMMDKIMIGKMSSITQVGFFSNSEKIIAIPLGIIAALGTVMIPKMSNLKARGDINNSKRYISLSIEIIIFIAMGAAFGLIAISPVLIPVFLDKEFIDCVPIVSLLAITIVFISWANVIRTQFLIPNKMDKIYIISTILGAMVNLISNLILIRRYGAIGATIGTILAECVVCIYQSIKVRRELEIIIYLKKCIFYIIPGFIMYIVVSFIGKNLGVSILTGLIQIVIGGFLYLFISILYMYKNKNEILLNIIDNILRKINRS